ncbi:sugar kinase [Kribbella catacumbae]|uniref:sugar kinase n=1 Tax=Kribbella catacumbae TaxID=460086 RepID=UPI000372DE7B|nr:sugar kinase [Kribbella catacumbae]
MPEVLTFGEAMVSLRSKAALRMGGDVHLSVAGSESNVAIGLARLGHDVAWLGAVGNDEPGRLIQRTLRAENVDTSYLRFSDDSFTGFIAFDQPAHDITRVSYHRRGSAGSTLTATECLAALAGRPSTAAATGTPTAVDLTGSVPTTTPTGTPSAVALAGSALSASPGTPRILHVTGITPALSDTARAATLAAVQAASAAGIKVSLDVNYRGRLWSRTDAAAVLRTLLPHVTTVFASDDELDILTDADDPVADLLSTTITEVVITAGVKGAWTHTTDGTLHRPALPVTVVDSIGAGDAFVSGYLSATLDNLPPEDRLARATTSGAFCVGAHGDWESLPTREDLTLLTHTHGTALR